MLPLSNVRDTSLESFDHLEKTGNRVCYESMIAEYIRCYGNATCDEIEVALNLRHQTVSSRLTALFQKSRIVDTKVRRVTRSGRSAIVWRIKRLDENKQPELF